VKLFLPQTTLEEWAADEKADLQGDELVLDDQSRHLLIPAVHFKSVISGEDDEKLVAKVKTQEQLHALSAEHLMDSVLLGDTAYEVAPGYVTEVEVEPIADDPSTKKGSLEADLLAAFLLDKLS
jgi:hypothetical protein